MTKEVWFLTGSQHLYGEDVLRQVADQSARVVNALAAADAIPVQVTSRPVLTTSDAIRLQKPLLHLHTQHNLALPWADIDMDFMNLNQSAHGDREFGYLATRLRRRRKIVVGHWEDAEVQRRIGVWTRAALGWHEAQRLRIARFGDNMREVAVTEGDKVEAEIRLGFSVNGYGVSELADRVLAVDDAAVDAVVKDYQSAYRVVPELRTAGPRHSSLRDAARIELGLRGFLDEVGAMAFTDTFEDLATLPQLPGIAVQRLMADGYGFGAEGDWKTAALVRLLKVMSAGLDGGTSFMEDYTYNLGAEEPQVLGAHMLEVCPSIASGQPACEIHPLAIGGRADPVRLVFTAPPGPGLVVGLVDLGTRLRLVANEVDVVRRERGRRRGAGSRAATAPGGPCRLGSSARSRHSRGVLAAGRRAAPHLFHAGTHDRGRRGPRGDRRRRTRRDRQ